MLHTERDVALGESSEAVTTLNNKDAPDEVYEQARAQFNETELVNLTLAVITINGWNRLNTRFAQRRVVTKSA